MDLPDSASQTARRGGRGARERILDAATTLFYRDGINATGVDRLAQQASVSKRTFYQHFSSKTELVEKYLRHLEDGAGLERERVLQVGDELPRERLLALFDGAPPGRMRGCPFHNAAVEAADAMPGVDDVVRRHKLAFTDRLIQLAEEADAKDPVRLGNQLAVLFEGACALATSLNDSAPFAHARSAAETLIDGAIGPSMAAARRGRSGDR